MNYRWTFLVQTHQENSCKKQTGKKVAKCFEMEENRKPRSTLQKLINVKKTKLLFKDWWDSICRNVLYGRTSWTNFFTYLFTCFLFVFLLLAITQGKKKDWLKLLHEIMITRIIQISFSSCLKAKCLNFRCILMGKKWLNYSISFTFSPHWSVSIRLAIISISSLKLGPSISRPWGLIRGT